MISKRAGAFDSSGIRKVFDLAAKLDDPINLSIGQPDFAMPDGRPRGGGRPPPPPARMATRPPRGSRASAERLEQRAREETGPARRRLCITSGSSGGLVLVLMSLVDPGDEVIIFEPAFRDVPACWSSFSAVKLRGASARPPASASTSTAWRRRSRRATKAILLNTPANPTGGGVVDGDTAARSRLARRTPGGVTIVISDELYRSYRHARPLRLPCPALGPRRVVIDGFSKSHAMTGWRVGWVHGPKPVVDACTMLQQYTFVIGAAGGPVGQSRPSTRPLQAAVSRECQPQARQTDGGPPRPATASWPPGGGPSDLSAEAAGRLGQGVRRAGRTPKKMLVVPGRRVGAARPALPASPTPCQRRHARPRHRRAAGRLADSSG